MSAWNTGYRPGIRGWWAFAYRYSPKGAVKREWVADFMRRARPSARLRQSEQERAYWAEVARLKGGQS